MFQQLRNLKRKQLGIEKAQPMVSCGEVLIGRYDVGSEVGREQHSAAPRLGAWPDNAQ